MGYYTSYKLDIIDPEGVHGPNQRRENLDIIDQFRKENDNAAYAIDEEGHCQESCKWYDSEKDLVEFSKKHPKTLFKLRGEGEESGDLWELYVQDGIKQFCKAKVVFDKLDYPKLLSDIRESKINKIIEK